MTLLGKHLLTMSTGMHLQKTNVCIFTTWIKQFNYMSDTFYLLKLYVWLTSALSNWCLRWALNMSVHFGVWAQNVNVSRRVGFYRWRHATKNRSMSHRSAVTFDTVCLILFVSCVLSFRLSLHLCFRCCFLFLISTSHHCQFTPLHER